MTPDPIGNASLLKRAKLAVRSFEVTVAERRALVGEQYAAMQDCEAAVTRMRQYLALAYDGLGHAGEWPQTASIHPVEDRSGPVRS